MNTAALKALERHPQMSDEIVKADKVYSLNFNNYPCLESYMRANKKVHTNNPLYSFYEAHCCALNKSSMNDRYDYAHIMMTVYVSPTLNPVGVTYASALRNVYGKMR